MSHTIRPLTAAHWDAVAAIYAAGIATGQATFESEPPSWAVFDPQHPHQHRFVAIDDTGRVLGWAAATPVSGRCVYAGVIEDSVYVAPDAQRRGVGRSLLTALVDSARGAGVWTVQAGIFPENTASLTLHLETGFRVVGTRERLGRMTFGPWAGHWRDVVLLEKRLPDPVGD